MNRLLSSLVGLCLLGGCSAPSKEPVAAQPVPPPQVTLSPADPPAGDIADTSASQPAEPPSLTSKSVIKRQALSDFLAAERRPLTGELQGLGQLIAEKRWAEAEGEIAGLRRQHGAKIPTHLELLLGALSGPLHLAQGRTEAADKEYRQVIDLWGKGGEAVKRIRRENPGQANPQLAVALESVGEALFYFADQKWAEAEALELPAFAGPATQKSVRKYAQTELRQWLMKKREAIATAEREYLEIVRLKPEPPPKWVVRASSRVGAMWAGFAADLRSVPEPAEWSGQLRQLYRDSLDAAREPLFRRALSAYSTCAGYAHKYKLKKDSFARSCDEWLESNKP